MGDGRLAGLGELRRGVERYAAGFDAALLTGADAASVVDDVAAIEKMAATLKSLASARASDTGDWRRRGARSPAHDLAQAAPAPEPHAEPESGWTSHDPWRAA